MQKIRTLFESDNEDYNEPIRTDTAFSSNYIEYKSNGDKEKRLSIEEYLNNIRTYFSNIIDDHKTHGERKIQLIIAIKFLSYYAF